MSTLDGYPLPATARHDEHGNHIPPCIPAWRAAADPASPHYDPMRAVRGSEVERDQRQKAAFHAHLEAHRRRGEATVVIEEV